MKNIKNILAVFKKKIFKHKIISGVLFLVLIALVFWIYSFATATGTQVKYVLAQAEKGTIVSSLSSSGSVSALDQIDIQSKASGNVVYVGVKEGQEVRAGQLLAQVDARQASQAVETAKNNLEKAQLDLKKMQGLTTGEGAIRGDKEKSADDLKKAYDDGFNTVANAFIDLPNIMVGLNTILYSNTFNNYQPNIDYYTYSAYNFNEKVDTPRKSVDASYKTAKTSYDNNFDDYKSATRFSDNATIDSLISETYETTKNIAQAIKDANNLIQFYEDTFTARGITPSATADAHLSSLSAYLGKVNSNLSSLYSMKTAIQNSSETLINVDFNVQDQEIQVKQMENSLSNAKDALSNYYIRAPFDGVIATVNASVGESVSGTVATIVTKTLVAEISFGETDIAKIKIGQKATLTFDAVSDLTITGKVSQVDIIGTSSQGVVSYNVKVVMDVQDYRIKPGMSTTATIITDIKTDALYVPSSAVKTQQGAFYVLKVADSVPGADIQNTAGVALKNSPTRQAVETGSSDDSSTEIISGLGEGDIVVSGTVSATKTAVAAQSTSAVRIPGVTGSAGGFRGN